MPRDESGLVPDGAGWVDVFQPSPEEDRATEAFLGASLPTREEGERAVELLIRRRGDDPTAILCFSDEMAIGVIGAANRDGVRIPEDLSLVGFDDIRFARYTDPPLTTISQPLRAIGEGTVRLLLEILSDHSKTPESVTLPHGLTIRSSTARPRSA